MIFLNLKQVQRHYVKFLLIYIKTFPVLWNKPKLTILILKVQKHDEYSSLLTSEEQYILEPLIKFNKRNLEIIKSIEEGNYNFLESLKDTQSKYTTVKFLNDTPSMVGNDLVKYGPFVKEEIATIPLENANILIKQNIAKELDVKN